MKTPILFLIFDRKDVSIKAFKQIQEYKPEKIYIAADGPRLNKTEESQRCEETRKSILDMIDWECEVNTLFQEENLGCANAVYSAITWFFKNEDYGCIIEDDVIVSQDFFKLCEELLPRYKSDERIAMITAMSFSKKSNKKSNQYVFSNNGIHVWGWATWKRAWKVMDMSMFLWPQIKLIDLIKGYGFFQGLFQKYYWQSAYKSIKRGNPINSWATRWAFNIFANKKFVIIPLVNLSKNIGISGIGGVHYDKNDKDPYSHMIIEKMTFPLIHPNEIVFDRHMQKAERKEFFRIRIIGLKKKLINKFKY